MNRDFLDYLEDITTALSDAMIFTKGMDYDEFVNDKKTVYAVIRALEIIGEAVKQLPESVKKKYADVPWKEMAGMRDKLIHSYFGVKLEVVWDTLQNELPPLKPQLDKILKDHQG
jgi:uncharacterized protein with HEPN domain